jgi:hypothetical protein
MPQTCTICRNERRREIDEALLRGEPYRLIAGRTGTSTAALARHKQNHIPASLATVKAAQDVEYAGTVFERLKAVNRETVAILQEARAADTPVVALMAVGRIEKQLELEAKLLGQLDESTKVAVGVQISTPNKGSELMAKLLAVMTGEELVQFRCLLDTAKARLPTGGIE